MAMSDIEEGFLTNKNPNFARFDNPKKKPKNQFPRVAYVLQGGGALGAYQAGAVHQLLESGYHPDWVAATSIGAIQGAIIAGNQPKDRGPKLFEFWDLVSTYSFFSPFVDSDVSQQSYNRMMESSAILFGQPNFYFPRSFTGENTIYDEPDHLSYYNTSPLRDTLIKLVDFDYLNESPVRLSLGAVQISNGHLVYFNNINYLIEPEHVMASGALPPGFPAIKIGDEYYWDGGVHSNSPLDVILEAIPQENTLCFLIDCFGGTPFIPETIDQIHERVKDISYGMHAQHTLLNYLHRQKMKHKVLELWAVLTPEQQIQCRHLLDKDTNPHFCSLVHLAYSSRSVKDSSKDCNFGRINVKARIQSGYDDVLAALNEKHIWGTLPKDGKSRLYECPNNLSRLFRKIHLDKD